MPVEEIRLTTTVARVLREFLETPSEPCYGFDLMRATGLASGTLYVILARLERAGWLIGVCRKTSTLLLQSVLLVVCPA